jgi:hypothetical protein
VYNAVAVQTDTTLSVSGKAADAKKTGDEISSLKEDLSAFENGFDASHLWCSRIKSIATGFYKTDGTTNSTNTSYERAEYDIVPNTTGIVIDKIYVAGSGSNYNVVGCYDKNGSYLGGLTNGDLENPAANVENVTYMLPSGTKTIGITWGNRPNNNAFFPVYQIGHFPINQQQRVINSPPNTSFVQQFFFHVLASDLTSIERFTLNTRLRLSRPVTSYELFYAGYTDGYAERILGGQLSERTAGISADGMTVDLHCNVWNTTKLVTGAYYVGFIVNLQYSAPSTDAATTGIQLGANYAVTVDYAFINNVVCTNTKYPSSGQNTNVVRHDEFNPMYGGRLCCIGDSLTGVYYKTEAESWPYLIAERNNMYYDNLGVSSRPLAKPAEYTGTCMAEMVDGMSASKRYTHIFVMGGANDYNESVPIGENTDTAITTFKGGVNHIISKLTELYPTAHIVFATTYRRTASRNDKKYADAMLEVCALNSIPCINNYANSGVQMLDSNWMAIHGANGTTSNKHLNAAGDYFVASRFENALKYGIAESGDGAGGESIDLNAINFTVSVDANGNATLTRSDMVNTEEVSY